ncbi:MAG: deoxyhypusine synthase [Thermoplasmata archaeon]|nr:deoxyhypusine synthase [Thermoplasmata archaeon]
MADKSDYLKDIIEHIDIKKYDVTPLVASMSKMAFQARNLAIAADIYDRMLEDEDCTIILSLAGSIFSAGLKKIVYDMVKNNMVDLIVSTGAIIVDMDFFEALGFKHYIGSPNVNDDELRKLNIDRIYDTFIDENEMQICDRTIKQIADSIEPRAYSSREFVWEMGKYLDNNGCKVADSVIYAAYEQNLPIFVPAFSDCSAGFGLLDHQRTNPDEHILIDSVRDFRELVEIVLNSNETGIVIIGGGVPKNFVQDAVLGGETDDKGRLIEDARMHKYAIQISLASEYDGALSGSTFKEASSWGKVDLVREQMVFSEASIAFPMLAGYAYFKNSWQARTPKEYTKMFLE